MIGSRSDPCVSLTWGMEKNRKVWGVISYLHDFYPKPLVFLGVMLESCGIAVLDDDTATHGWSSSQPVSPRPFQQVCRICPMFLKQPWESLRVILSHHPWNTELSSQAVRWPSQTPAFFPIHLCHFCLQENLQLPALRGGHSLCSFICSAYLMLCDSMVFAGERNVICSLEVELDLVQLSFSLPMLFLLKFLVLGGVT